jgi:hypothetical protein
MQRVGARSFPAGHGSVTMSLRVTVGPCPRPGRQFPSVAPGMFSNHWQSSSSRLLFHPSEVRTIEW